MDDPKPSAKEYHEGPKAAKAFEALVKRAVSVSRDEIERRHKVWQKTKKAQRKKTQ